MSELKAKSSGEIRARYALFGYWWYEKSEVDAVIEELKAQKAQTEDDCAYWKTMAQKNAADNAVMAKQRAEALKKESRHKYKRCLAMAYYCYTNVHCIIGHRLCSFADWKKEWFERWHKRWLELAEKFKEVNNASN